MEVARIEFFWELAEEVKYHHHLASVEDQKAVVSQMEAVGFEREEGVCGFILLASQEAMP